MERKKANDFPPEVLRLFNRYIHGGLDRRGFLQSAAKFAVGGLSAAAMLESLTPNYAFAQQVRKDDARIRTEYASYPSPKGSAITRGYLAAPAAAGKQYPGVVVMHENRGLTPYIEDVARRLAVANFVAFAPDALAPLGGYPGTEEEAAKLFAKLDGARIREDMVAAAAYLKSRPECSGRIGAVGFCYGGSLANMLAVRIPDLGAAVPFYGGAPKAADVASIKAPLLIHYAENDEWATAAWPAYEAALKANGVRYETHIYPGTYHGFHNDTTPRYDEAAAKLAWQRTVDFFNRELRGA